jgi:hypothetical protein
MQNLKDTHSEYNFESIFKYEKQHIIIIIVIIITISMSFSIPTKLQIFAEQCKGPKLPTLITQKQITFSSYIPSVTGTKHNNVLVHKQQTHSRLPHVVVPFFRNSFHSPVQCLMLSRFLVNGIISVGA